MTYNISAAWFANEDHTAAVIVTENGKHILTSQVDTPDVWGDVIAFGPTPFKPNIDAPVSVPMWKVKAALAMAGKLSAANAAVSASGNDVVMLAWEYASEISRNSDALRMMASALKLSDDEVDQLFIAASKIVI